MKSQVFELPFIGYDQGKTNNWPFDCLIGRMGNPIVGIKIKNAVEQYSADPESYIAYHAILNQVIATLGENRILQKLDIFSKQAYKAEVSTNYLQQKYSDHFEGRSYKTITTLLFLTDRLDPKKKVYEYNENRYKDLRDKAQKIFMLLEQQHLEPVYLFQRDFEHYLAGILSMEFRAIPSYDNIYSTDEYLKIGSRFVKTITLVDKEKIELPAEIEPYSVMGGSGTAAETAVDNLTFLNEIEDYQTIVYNQVFSIPPQAWQQRELEKKQKKHEGAAKNAPSNDLVAKDIADFLSHVAMDGQLIVEAHFSILYSVKTKEQLEKTTSLIENKLFMKGVVVSHNSQNQLELFRACLPGNATELRPYDLFLTSSEAALCFFFKESYPIDDKSSFYLRFTDRQGVPLKVDPSDLPMATGRVNNRNKFVLGPSGSGKSFLMNNIVEQYLNYNYDVVIVDVGDSYSGTCAYKGGRYIQYTEENPITMNPFNLKKEEFNIEKTEFLTNLIFLIWRGADAVMTNAQKSILDKLLLSYYHQYYDGGTEWFEARNTEDLLLYLNRYNIFEDDVSAELQKRYERPQTYYDLLEVPADASTAEIRKKGRDLLKRYHPDTEEKAGEKTNTETFYKIYEAYDTLTDEQKRTAYDISHLILAEPRELVKPNSPSEWKTAFRQAVIKRILKIEKDLVVPELSFNSFYEYSERFLPIYLNNQKHKINEQEFNLRTFLLVLADFYKGGRYEKTLNESANESLFNENFVVFEIDNVKDNPKLFPIVTLIIMDTFIQKMRLRKDRRKAIIIEEAWKAIASRLMGGYILYLYKTVRKFWGEAIVVTQELGDIVGNAVVKDSIISNSDTYILLDQTKFKDNFNQIADILSLNKVEQNKIFTINNLNNKYGRSRFKEFYLKRGAKGEVYGNEVSIEQYLTYTTEKPEKVAMEYYVETSDSYDMAIQRFVKDLILFGDPLPTMVSLINLYQAPLDRTLLHYYQNLKKKHPRRDLLKLINGTLNEQHCTLNELIKTQHYETV